MVSQRPPRTILFQYPDFGRDRLFDPARHDGVSEPYIHLRAALRERGYDLRTADDHRLDNAAAVWFWDVPNPAPLRWRHLKRLVKRLTRRLPSSRDWLHRLQDAGAMRRTVLFLGEPPSVKPENFEPALHRPFPVIFTWDDRLVDGQCYHKFRLPLPATYPAPPPPPFRERKLLVNISSNKASTHPDELYSARRRTIAYFEAAHPTQFDLYGTGWNSEPDPQRHFASYRGTIDHKWRLFPSYRFGLCYENIAGIPGYVTEKLFDCLRAGAVPVYWGAPNVADDVDADAFVDRRQFADDAELARFLADVGERDYARYREAAADYLHSARFAAFLPPAFADTIIRVLGL